MDLFPLSQLWGKKPRHDVLKQSCGVVLPVFKVLGRQKADLSAFITMFRSTTPLISKMLQRNSSLYCTQFFCIFHITNKKQEEIRLFKSVICTFVQQSAILNSPAMQLWIYTDLLNEYFSIYYYHSIKQCYLSYIGSFITSKIGTLTHKLISFC